MEEKMGELLAQYPLEIKHMYRGRGAWILDTDQGLKLIRPYENSPERLQWEWYVKNELKARGCKYIDHIVPKSDGELLTKDSDEKNYIVTEWFGGRECNMKDRQEVVRASLHLALLHGKMYEIPKETDEMQVYQGENQLQEMHRRIRELKMIRNYSSHKKQKNDFDRKYINVYTRYVEDACRAIEILKDMDYLLLHETCQKKNILCHGDYNQHNLFIHKDTMAVVRFEHMHPELQLYDLYLFMRKVLEKNRWNIGLGMAMLDAYTRIMPVNYKQIRCFYSFMLFPEKFWKIANRYQNTRKSWMSEQNMGKLNKVIQEQEARDEFMSCLDKYCEKIE